MVAINHQARGPFAVVHVFIHTIQVKFWLMCVLLHLSLIYVLTSLPRLKRIGYSNHVPNESDIFSSTMTFTKDRMDNTSQITQLSDIWSWKWVGWLLKQTARRADIIPLFNFFFLKTTLATVFRNPDFT